MRVSPAHPVAGISGRFRRSPMVFYMRGNHCFARAYLRPRDPRTPRQLDSRTHMASVSSAWRGLSAAQRDAWEEYGKRWFENLRAPGLNTYMKVSAFTEQMPADAPVEPPPPQITSAMEMPVDEPGSFAFVIKHTIAEIAGWRVLVCTTPATSSLKRAPRDRDFRWVCGRSSTSFTALPASGGVVCITNALQPVVAGSRYGVRLRLVSPEGVPGPVLELDLVRQSGKAPRAVKQRTVSKLPRVSLFFTPGATGTLLAKNDTCIGPIRALRRSSG